MDVPTAAWLYDWADADQDETGWIERMRAVESAGIENGKLATDGTEDRRRGRLMGPRSASPVGLTDRLPREHHTRIPLSHWTLDGAL